MFTKLGFQGPDTESRNRGPEGLWGVGPLIEQRGTISEDLLAKVRPEFLTMFIPITEETVSSCNTTAKVDSGYIIDQLMAQKFLTAFGSRWEVDMTHLVLHA